jgi:TetR/AcrR family transcriptional repressor of lmrAB and yxaGH operons
MSGELLRASEYADGCPVATMTLEAAHTSEPIRAACAASYEDWERRLAEYLVAHGIDRDRAAALALLTLAAVEGGLILSRARRSPAALEQLSEVIASLVADVRTAKRSTNAGRKPPRKKPR